MDQAAVRDRQRHRAEVEAFLDRHFAVRRWEFSLPRGTGHETYFAHGGERALFVKLGADAARYEAMATLGLTPPLLASGHLEDGMSIVVQSRIAGRQPTRKDYRAYLDRIAAIISQMHRSAEVSATLGEAVTDQYRDAALRALGLLRQRWERHKAQVPGVADFVDESLAILAQQAEHLEGAGLVASHNDICNANWLVASDEHIYLLDLDSMALDDPACDIGATLWWYYPPGLRRRFLAIAGYADQAGFEERMRVRMAMHCLSIVLPRDEGFDQFAPKSFASSLTDFRAALAGDENPEGYDE